ncbi:MAG: nucleotide exchange factor GrpE [Brevinematales bacterium]|nr:nucleotide exchange factor GrpE [Brevinematales bacterium]
MDIERENAQEINEIQGSDADKVNVSDSDSDIPKGDEDVKDTNKDQDKVKKIKEFILNLKKEIELKESKIREYEDLIKRLAADFDNYKKKVNKEKVEYVRFATKDFILDLLPIIDNFDRAIESIERANLDDSAKDIFIGIKLIYKELMNVLLKYGVVRIDMEGKIYDPNISEVIEVEEVEVEDDDKDVVVKEYLKAYKMYDNVIRPGKVKVQKQRKKSKEKNTNNINDEGTGSGGVSSSS